MVSRKPVPQHAAAPNAVEPTSPRSPRTSGGVEGRGEGSTGSDAQNPWGDNDGGEDGRREGESGPKAGIPESLRVGPPGGVAAHGRVTETTNPYIKIQQASENAVSNSGEVVNPWGGSDEKRLLPEHPKTAPPPIPKGEQPWPIGNSVYANTL